MFYTQDGSDEDGDDDDDSEDIDDLPIRPPGSSPSGAGDNSGGGRFATVSDGEHREKGKRYKKKSQDQTQKWVRMVNDWLAFSSVPPDPAKLPKNRIRGLVGSKG